MYTDVASCRRAVSGRDRRFDGWFYTGVLTTGIYCRPSCPARTPKDENMRFFPSAAAAQGAGFRACRRCRPDATPGSPEWNTRADVAARTMRLIADGVLDREGVPGLAAQVGYSTRQLQRLLLGELGAGPLAIARAQRAQTARLLLESTEMPVSEVAFAAGFSSIRSFNETFAQVYALSPSRLREARRGGDTARRSHGRAAGEGTDDDAARGAGSSPRASLSLRLPYRAPLEPDNVFGHLIATGVPGVEEWDGTAYRATLRLPGGPGIVALAPGEGFVDCTLELADLRDLAQAINRCRRLLDLDADPESVDTALGADPLLRPLVEAHPGRRVPRILDPAQFAIRAVLGQQVSTAAARTHAGRLVAALGELLPAPSGALTHLFPDPAAIADAPDELLAMPRARRDTVRRMAAALASGELELGPGADWERARAVLHAMPGIGPWTVESIAMRALGDPDAFIPGDLGVRKAAEALGLPATPGALTAHSARWRPYRAYAVQYLWAAGDHPINHIPAGPAVAPGTTAKRRTRRA